MFNVLNLALSALGTQSILYRKFVDTTTDSVGMQVANYEEPIVLQASVQAVPRKLMVEYGLNFQNNYLKIYVSAEVIDIGRNISGDLIIYKDKTYQCQSVTNWYDINGWVGILAVEVNNG